MTPVTVQKNRKRASRHYYQNREKKIAYQLEYHLLKSYGLSLEQYQDMVLSQSGKCALCAKKPEYSLHVDHDHATGKVRGLLCARCNAGLGYLESMLPNLGIFLEYLQKGKDE